MKAFLQFVAFSVITSEKNRIKVSFVGTPAAWWVAQDTMMFLFVRVGGDGLPNCLSGSKCHIPMTATVYNPATGLSVVVSIVDRCDIATLLPSIYLITDIYSDVRGVLWEILISPQLLFLQSPI